MPMWCNARRACDPLRFSDAQYADDLHGYPSPTYQPDSIGGRLALSEASTNLNLISAHSSVVTRLMKGGTSTVVDVSDLLLLDR
jgi:hypothetical protein